MQLASGHTRQRAYQHAGQGPGAFSGRSKALASPAALAGVNGNEAELSSSRPALARSDAVAVTDSQAGRNMGQIAGSDEPRQKSGRKAVQFAVNEGSQRRLIDIVDAKMRRQKQENESAAEQTVSPGSDVPGPPGQVPVSALPSQLPQLQNVLRSKPSAKRTKPRSNFVEGF